MFGNSISMLVSTYFKFNLEVNFSLNFTDITEPVLQNAINVEQEVQNIIAHSRTKTTGVLESEINEQQNIL
jgi:hypothetical protein